MSKVKEVLDSNNLQYRPSGSQYILEDCPSCGDDGGHFYINKDTGLWDCKKCRESGNLFTLRKLLEDLDDVSDVSKMFDKEDIAIISNEVNQQIVDDYHNKLLNSAVGLKYLLGRGLTKETIHQFKLGLYTDNNSKHWIAIPYFLKGVPVNFKFRSLPAYEGEKKEFRQIPNAPNPLWNQDSINKKEPVYVTEGEFDAMVMIQNGFNNTVSVPLGCNTFKPEHFDELVVCNKIYLLFDSDQPGRDGVKEVADRLGPERCFDVKLPVKDVSEFFDKYSLSEFYPLLQEAKRFSESSVLTLRESLGEYLASKNDTTSKSSMVYFPWENVSSRVGPIRPGMVVVLQARPKIGKTSMCLQMLLEMARKDNIPTMLYCLEMTPADLAERSVCQIRKIEPGKISTMDIYHAAAEVKDVPFYIGRNLDSSLTAKKVFDTIRYARKRFGIKFVVFDHLHFLCRSDNATTETGRVMRDFKMLMTELNIAICIITHPKKGNPNEAPGMYSTRDSGEVPGDCDLLLSMHREMNFKEKTQSDGKTVNEENFVESDEAVYGPKTMLEVTVGRFSKGGRAILYWDESSLSFVSPHDWENKFEVSDINREIVNAN